MHFSNFVAETAAIKLSLVRRFMIIIEAHIHVCLRGSKATQSVSPCKNYGGNFSDVTEIFSESLNGVLRYCCKLLNIVEAKQQLGRRIYWRLSYVWRRRSH